MAVAAAEPGTAPRDPASGPRDPASGPPEVATPDAWRVLAVCAAAVFVVFLDTTIVNIAFDAMRRDFRGTSTGSLSWVLNAYAVVFSALLVPAGRLADQIGRRRVFLAGLVGFAATSAACGLAPNVPSLVAFRALQAIAGALLVPTSLALLLPEFPVARRSAAVGAWGAMGALAAASGPVLGAVLTENLSWRWIFYVNVPICLGAAVVGRRLLREARDPGERGLPDVPSIALVIAVPALLSLGLVEGVSRGWGDGLVVGALAGAVLAVPLLVWRTVRARDPLVDPALFRVATYRWANVGTVGFAAAFYGTVLLNVLFLQRVWGWSVLTTAVAVTPSPVLAAVIAPLSGRLADRVGHRALLVPGALSFAAGQLWLAWQTGSAHSYVSVWLPGALLIGAGIGLAFPTLSAAAAASLPPTRFAVGSAVNASFRQVGAVLGIAVLVAVLGTPTPAHALTAFHHTWVALSLAALLCAAASLRVRPTLVPGVVPNGLPAYAD